MNWWFNLTNIEQIFIVVALGCFIILLTKVVMEIVEFYKIDNLNAERQELENYDQIANEDSDVEKKQPKFFSLVSINLLILSFIAAYFILRGAILSKWIFVISAVIAFIVFFVFSSLKFSLRKNKK